MFTIYTEVKYILRHVVEHFQIQCNYIILEIDQKLNFFCRNDFRDFVEIP